MANTTSKVTYTGAISNHPFPKLMQSPTYGTIILFRNIRSGVVVVVGDRPGAILSLGERVNSLEDCEDFVGNIEIKSE